MAENSNKRLKDSAEDIALSSDTPDHEDIHSQHHRSLGDIIDALKIEGVRLDKYRQQGDDYEVETVLKASDQEWFFSAAVKRNGVEITDNIELARETFRRKRVTQANKSKALWNLFVKGAAESHIYKCHAVKKRAEQPKRSLLRNKTRLFSVLGVLVLAGAGIFIYVLGPIPSIVNLKPQKPSRMEEPFAESAMPSNPDLVSIKTIEPVVQPKPVPLAPKSKVAPIPEKPIKEPEASDHKLSSQSVDSSAKKVGSQAIPEVKSDPKIRATPTTESKVPSVPEPPKPPAQEISLLKPTKPPTIKVPEQHAAEPKTPSAPVETQSQEIPEPEVQPVQEKPTPAPEGQPAPMIPEAASTELAAPPAQASQPPENTDSKDSQSSESARQQTPKTLSPEEIQKKVKMLLKTN